jgi:hypothetical protein
VIVSDRYGVWTAVTEDMCARGCRIVTSRLLRVGTRVKLAISSDLFPEELETTAVAVWAAPERLGVIFTETAPRRGTLGPDAWIDKVIEHGETPDSSATARLVPSVVAWDGHVPSAATTRNGRIVRSFPASPDSVVRLPLRRV